MAKITNLKTCLTMAVILLGLGCRIAAGVVIYVDADALGPTHDGTTWTYAYLSLQDALNKPPIGGDEIWVAAGTYKPGTVRIATFQLISGVALYGGFAGTETSLDERDWETNETILSGDLLGNDGPGQWENNNENSYHVVTGSGTDATAILDGFTITAGNANFWHDHIYGAGIYCIAGSPTISNCFIIANLADGDGGGIYGESASPTITNCTISNNDAREGGGVFDCDGEISGCTIINNAAVFGGGLSNCDGTISHCTIADNTTNDWGLAGGGLFRCNGTISHCRITGNYAAEYGGGLCGTVLMENCVITGNISEMVGGGLNFWEGNVSIRNCTIADNVAGLSGGGIHCTGQDWEWVEVSISNSILWGNEADMYGPQIALEDVPKYSDGGSFSANYCDVQGEQSDVYLGAGWTLSWGPGNIDTDPCCVEPGVWDDNGTPVDKSDDIWTDGDYHLQSEAGRWNPNSESWVIDEVTSRCIDAGNPGCPVGDEPEPNGNRINMGTYGGTAEASKSPANWALLADLTNDNTVNFVDLKLFLSYWLDAGPCIPSDLDRSQHVDLADFAFFAAD